MAYFANGSEGEYLQDQCADCVLGQAACPILHVQMVHNYDQCRPGNEVLRQAMDKMIDDNGDCQMRVELLKVGVKPNGVR